MASDLSWYLALRHLRGRRSRLLNGAAWSGLGSVALGVAAMVVAMALMSGYTSALLDKMLLGGALIVVPVGQPEDRDVVADRLAELPGVSEVGRSLLVQGTLTSVRATRSAAGVDVLLRGVEPAASGPLGAGELAGGEANDAGRTSVPGVRLGSDLARRLGVDVGDAVRLVALDLERGGGRFRYRTLRVVGLFETGFALFDREYAIMDLEQLRSVTGGLPFLELALESPRDLDPVRSRVERMLADDYIVRDWRQSSPGLFTALRLQKWGLFLWLGLIVVVSTFNVAAALFVLIRERTRETGILMALGTERRTLRRSFFWAGSLLGASGCALGLAGGAVLAWVLSRLEVLSFAPGVQEIYFVDRIPLETRLLDLTLIAAFTLLVVLVAVRWPLRRIDRLRPSEALRAR